MKIKLIIKKLNEIIQSQVVDVMLEPLVMGRHTTPLALDEPHISREHVKIEWNKEAGQLLLIRLSKTGKVLLDGKNIESEELILPSTFEIPPFSFIVEPTVEVAERAEEKAEEKKEIPEPDKLWTPTPESFPVTLDEEEIKSDVTRVTSRTIKAKIIILKGKSPFESYDIVGEELTLGRDPACDIVLDDPKISREHTKIFLKNKGFLITDMGSSNGTFVNHTQIMGEHPLISSDQIQLGDTILQFALFDESAYALSTQFHNKNLSSDSTVFGLSPPDVGGW